MPQVEAGACGKPVIGIKAMAMLDTLVHGETAYLADVAQEIRISETIVGAESGYESHHRVVFPLPRTADYRASFYDIAEGLRTLMKDSELRRRMGEAGRQRVQKLFDYRVVAQQFLDIIQRRLGID